MEKWFIIFLLIVVGQALWFRVHVRCSFFIIESIKTMEGVVGPNPKSKNLKTWKGKIIRWVPSHSTNHFVLPLPFAFSSAPLLGNFGIPQFAFPISPTLKTRALPFLNPTFIYQTNFTITFLPKPC